MRALFRNGWRRDVLVAVVASVLTGAVLLPLGRAALVQQRERADAAYQVAVQALRLARQDASQARDQAQRALMDQATDFLGNAGGPEQLEAQVRRVTTSAVAPEVPDGAYVLIDKKVSSYAVGDIVVVTRGNNQYLGRVVGVDNEARRLTVGRNSEPDRQVAFSEVVGRTVLNTR